MSDNLLLSNIWTFGAIVTVLLVGFVELGSRIGPRLHAQKKDEARRSQIGGVQGAVLGLLGFTFSMAVNRYETRRNPGVITTGLITHWTR